MRVEIRERRGEGKRLEDGVFVQQKKVFPRSGALIRLSLITAKKKKNCSRAGTNKELGIINPPGQPRCRSEEGGHAAFMTVTSFRKY